MVGDCGGSTKRVGEGGGGLGERNCRGKIATLSISLAAWPTFRLSQRLF